MSDSIENFIYTEHGRADGNQGASHHDHRDTKCTGGGDLTIGGVASAIFGHHNLYATPMKQCSFIAFVERSSGKNILGAPQLGVGINSIDTAHDIMMLRRGAKRAQFLPADGQENHARHMTKPRDSITHGLGINPAIAIGLLPGRSTKPNQRHLRHLRGAGCIGRDAGSKRMRRVDQQIDLLSSQELREPFGATEAATARVSRLRKGRLGTTGERKNNAKVCGRSQAFDQLPRIASTAKNKNASGGHHAF